MQDINGIGPVTVEKLKSAGITTVEALARPDAASVAEKSGISETRLFSFIDRAKNTNQTIEASVSPPVMIDDRIAELPTWQGVLLSRNRRLIKQVETLCRHLADIPLPGSPAVYGKEDVTVKGVFCNCNWLDLMLIVTALGNITK